MTKNANIQLPTEPHALAMAKRATQAACNNTPIDRLQDAGDWNSPAMPLRYVEAAKIANEGVKLG